MGIWDYLFGLASPDHPRIQREGQDFVASNPPGPAGAVLRFFTQNIAKQSPNTQEILEARQSGIKEEIVWISPQPGAGEPQRQAPIAVAKLFEDSRGRRSGELIDLRHPEQRVIVEYPEEVDFDDLVKLGQQGTQQRPDRARVFIDNNSGERFATNQQVDPNQVRAAREATEAPQGGQSRATRPGITIRDTPRRSS